MSRQKNQMTKAEARELLGRAREAMRWANDALRDGDASGLNEALMEVVGAVATIQTEMHADGNGVVGVK